MLRREIIAAYCENYIWIRDRSLKFVLYGCQTHSQNYEQRLLALACLSGFRSVCLFRCLSAWNNSSPTDWIFIKFNLRIFTKSVEKIRVSLTSDRNIVCVTWRTTYPYLTSLNYPLNEKHFRKICKEHQNKFYVPRYFSSVLSFMGWCGQIW